LTYHLPFVTFLLVNRENKMNAQQKTILEALTNPRRTVDVFRYRGQAELLTTLWADHRIKLGRVALKKHLDALADEGLLVSTSGHRPKYAVNVAAALDALAPPPLEEPTEELIAITARPIDQLVALVGLT
jgi:hypothetical protein